MIFTFVALVIIVVALFMGGLLYLTSVVGLVMGKVFRDIWNYKGD